MANGYWDSGKQEWVYTPEPRDTQGDLIFALQQRCAGLESERASWRRVSETLENQVQELLIVISAAFDDYEDHDDAGCYATLKACLRKWGKIK